jgi:1-acyl-sn-glycerol-3-phosphate acyltransferase
MVYNIVWLLARLTHHFYFRRTYFSGGAELDKKEGSGKLFAANHPNSFIDAISLAIQLPYPIYFLARGDALKGPAGRFLMKHLKLLPVWREREGRDNLKSNYDTFDTCLNIWRQGGAVIIFSEGLCVNEWHLRPLPKGTARMAQAAIEKGVALEVIPTGFNYGHFRGPGKSLSITTLPAIDHIKLLQISENSATAQKNFNDALRASLEQLVWEAKDQQEAAEMFPKAQKSSLLRRLLYLPAWLLHSIYYLPLKKFVTSKTAGTVHYDSVLFGLLMVTYPVFLLLIWALLAGLGVTNSFCWMLLWPLTAWLYART